MEARVNATRGGPARCPRRRPLRNRSRHRAACLSRGSARHSPLRDALWENVYPRI